MNTTTSRRWPAEWEAHRATWISWPHEETDWPEKLTSIDWVYTEIVRALAPGEIVEIICKNQEVKAHAADCLVKSGVGDGYRLHILATDRSWLRDTAPTAVIGPKGLEWITWQFNAWAKYKNFELDRKVPELISTISKCPISRAFQAKTQIPLVLEGGAIDCDGQGTLLTTEECLLSKIQERNPGLNREGYELAFAENLGIKKTIWLGQSCEGDDTHGHVDDVARFVSPNKVVLSYESDPASVNHKASVDNLKRLELARDAQGRSLEVIKLPTPSPRVFRHEHLPCSYANFYIGNKAVIVPTFNDENDYEVLGILRKLFPTRKVIGIHAVDLVLGFGTLHCLSQQEPLVG